MTCPHLKSFVVAALLVVSLFVATVPAHAANGIILDIIVSEHLDADPPDSAIVDSVSYPVVFGRKTTVRAGNFITDVMANASGSGAVALSASILVTGPLPGNSSGEARVASGSAMTVTDIRGKGKSRYSARFVPREADVVATLSMTEDTAHWETVYSLRSQYMIPNGVLPSIQFLPVRRVLDFEFEAMVDTFSLVSTDRVLVYLPPGNLAGHPSEPEYGYSVDPSRYKVYAENDPFHPRVRPQALALAAVYRLWGYAPRLLATGVAGYFGMPDYDVIKDRTGGHSIPLDSLARSIDYKRHDRSVADHHAESFVTWLVTTYGVAQFKTLYERATDQSIHRAVWSVYNQTLPELESKWLTHLKSRTFGGEELTHYAMRALAFRDFATHVELMDRALTAVNSPPQADALRKIALAEGQLGRWSDVTRTLTRLVNEFPDENVNRLLLVDAQRASGDDIGAWRTSLELQKRQPFDPQTNLRMGDIQWDVRRVDSAATFWRRGLTMSTGPFAGAELHLRMGWYFSERRKGQDSARFHFSEARRLISNTLANNPTDGTAWIIAGESLFGVDSVHAALEHLTLAQAVTDAPVELGRLHILRGKCYDKLDRRKDAIIEYQKVSAVNGGAPAVKQAQKWLTRAYGR